VTGLKADQQRLIYRGRIINSGQSHPQSNSSSSGGGGGANVVRTSTRQLTEAEQLLGDHPGVPNPSPPVSPSNNNDDTATDDHKKGPRVRDVNGLCDQQTIHLVPRPHVPTNNVPSGNNGGGMSMGGMPGGIGSLLGAMGDLPSGSTGEGSNNASVTSLSGEAGMSLLAALLGLPSSGGTTAGGGGVPSDNTNTNNGASASHGEGTSDDMLHSTGLGGIMEHAIMMGVIEDNDTGNTAGNATVIGVGGQGMEGIARGHLADPSLPLGSLLGFGPASSNTAAGSTATTTTAASPLSGNHQRRRQGDETFPNLAPLGNTARRTMSRRARAPSAAARARATAARLTEADARAPDPGSVEPVRQGLLTLHTLLGNALLDRERVDRDRMTAGEVAPALPSVRAMDHAHSVAGEVVDAQVGPDTARTALPLIRAPLDSHRQWYRGQWLDALDTVNQWLEATVVDIVMPCDILPGVSVPNGEADHDNANANANDAISKRRTRRQTPDAVVSANDMEGRRRLLLEPIPNDSNENDNLGPNNPFAQFAFTDHEGTNQLTPRQVQTLEHRRQLFLDENDAGYRPRSDNSGIQLLLVHYNGWPHRWDEWIRSDSERIRPFRTRTRHFHRANSNASAGSASVSGGATPAGGGGTGGGGNGSGGNYGSTLLSSPTPQAVFGAAPSTHIQDEENNGEERMGMLQELGRVLGSVNDILNSAIAVENVDNNGAGGNALAETLHLPWRTRPRPANHRTEAEILLGPPQEHDDEVDSATSSITNPLNGLDSARLRQLAPLLDRLGRTLTDAAPHILLLADSLPVPVATAVVGTVPPRTGATSGTELLAQVQEEEEEDPIQRLAARASHLYFGIGDNDDDDENENNDSRTLPATVSLAQPASMMQQEAVVNQEVIDQETTTIIDPDLTDFINGMVNTTPRGNNGRGRSGGGNNDRGNGLGGDSIGSSLLAQYLASLGGSLGGAGAGAAGGVGGAAGGADNGGNNEGPRVIRMGGGGNGGPGGGIGGLGGVGGPGIDIHIHAIVTGPGMAGATGVGGIGGLGGLMAGMGGVATTTTTNDTAADDDAFGPSFNNPAFSTAAASSPQNNNEQEEDTADLFSELYSESPRPVNLHGEEEDAEMPELLHDNINIPEIDDDDYGQLFDECRSIEEEEESSDGYDEMDSCGGDDDEMETMEAELILDVALAALAPNAANARELLANDSIANAAISSRGGSSESLLALSEIESQEGSTATMPPSTPTTPTVTPTMLMTSSSLRIQGGSSSGGSSTNTTPSRSSPSLSNRLFRRAFGRLSNSSSRRSGSGSSAP